MNKKNYTSEEIDFTKQKVADTLHFNKIYFNASQMKKNIIQEDQKNLLVKDSHELENSCLGLYHAQDMLTFGVLQSFFKCL